MYNTYTYMTLCNNKVSIMNSRPVMYFFKSSEAIKIIEIMKERFNIVTCYPRGTRSYPMPARNSLIRHSQADVSQYPAFLPMLGINDMQHSRFEPGVKPSLFCLF